MLRRLLHGHVAACAASIRHTSEEPNTPEAIRELIQNAENEREQRERVVDTRKVVFSSASSADHRPRIAAAEAFDVAAAALPHPPNFCYMNVSLDYAAMIDAPEVVWFNMCRANGVTPSTVKSQMLHMVGGTVCHQRLGGGYIQVVLGTIPDLESDAFTFDTVPESAEIHDKGRLSPVVCFASLDTKLSLQYERVLSGHLNTLHKRLGKDCPLVGGLYPSVNSNSEREKTSELDDSIFFVNDRVYKGSAAAVLLRSNSLKARSFSVVPSISVGTVKAGGVSSSDGIYTIRTLDAKQATAVIKDIYMSDDLRDKLSKVFIGIRSGDVHVPISFIGDPANECIMLSCPDGLALKDGDMIDLLVDDAELDTEAAASLLIAMEKEVAPLSVEKDITVAREARKSVVASNVAAFHFSQGGLNVVGRPDTPVINLGNSNMMFAPSILQRCVGRTCANSGIFCSGQVATVANTTGIFARSSTYCFLEGLS